MKITPLPVVLTLGLLGLAAAVFAQMEGGDRGVAPIDSSGSFEVTGIDVDVAAKTADAARLGGWRLAQRKGWQMLWAKMHGGASGAPGLSDSDLDSIVAGIVVDDEQIGPNRYVAKLGVLFDRARAGQILGVSGQIVRSPPLLVIPVEWSGGAPRSLETRSEWQKAWARFRAGASPIDYVRPSGTGSDPLLLTAGQAQRPSRKWWRILLDQYGAADVLMPQVRLERLWPGGPVVGHFSARHGPDNIELSAFTLRVESSDGLPQMLDEGVRRIDQAYADALSMGMLRPDPSLIIETPVDVSALIANEADIAPIETGPDNSSTAIAGGEVRTYTVQFDTPDVSSVTGIEGSVRGVPGVKSTDTTSLALGGTSVMRVSFVGDMATLRLGLAARGFRVDEGSGTLRIRRLAPADPSSAP
ncbi:heavy-metal-associated domain-containing protein [Sphingomonas sp.]|uniref:heavy-metal-associated domain-containing protein n=1 Tax=Sphingomonas sp. TaxID=28214 RepID=UPI0025D46F23|nr:heavy-metal-associated domain-containing protein [Sphingomonas sp.]